MIQYISKKPKDIYRESTLFRVSGKLSSGMHHALYHFHMWWRGNGACGFTVKVSKSSGRTAHLLRGPTFMYPGAAMAHVSLPVMNLQICKNASPQGIFQYKTKTFGGLTNII